MDEFVETISAIPSARLIPIGLLFFCGLILWGAGRRIMRPGFAAAGFILGGLIGVAAGEGADLGVEPWIAAAGGAVIFAVVAIAAYRLALAGTVGLLVATIAPMAVWTADERNLVVFDSTEQAPLAAPAETVSTQDPPVVEGTEGLSQEVEDWLDDIFAAPPDNNDAIDPLADAGEDDDVGDTLRRPIDVAVEKASMAWNEAPAALRGSFLAAASFGAMLGFVIGALAPGLSAIAVSALGGSFLILTTGWVIGARFLPEPPAFTGSATFWLAAWLVLAVLGLGLQWMFRPKQRAANGD